MGSSVVRLPKDEYGIYYSDEGSLGVYERFPKGTVITWNTCRETFHDHFPNVKRILFKTDYVGEVVAFVRHAERMLKLPKADRVKFRQTNDESILYCSLSPWWASKVRSQLFTILLRAGKHYNKKNKNFWKAAFKHPYISLVKGAFERFMRGHTDYVGGKLFGGWVDTFYYIPSDELNVRLVKSADRKRKKVSSAGVRGCGAGNRSKGRANSANRAKVSCH